MSQQNVNISNRRAYFDFEILDKLTAGIMLTGTEIKSIREGKANINEAFCIVTKDDELFIRNMHITEYSRGSYYNHEPLRPRKLLLNKKEIVRWGSKIKEKGLTLVPLKVFLSDRGFIKIDIGLAKGKKTHDKRDSIKAKDSKREIDRVMKRY
jgi:SsrA-binding protein